MFKGQARNSVTIKTFCSVYNVTKIITYEITYSWLWYLLFDLMTCLSVEVCQMILFFSTFKILFLVFRYLDVLFTLWALHPLPSWLAAISTITGHVITWLIVFTGTTDIDTLVAKHPWSTFWKRIKLIRSWIINYSLITIGSRTTLLAWSVYFDWILLDSFIFNNFQALQNLRLECRKVRNIFTLVTERQIFPTRLTVINALSCHVMTFQISTTVTR